MPLVFHDGATIRMDGLHSPPGARSPLRRSAAEGWAEASVATYNLHRWVGLDRRYNPERTAEVAAELNVDLLGVQEVDARKPRHHGGDPMEALARRLGGAAALGPLLRGPRGAMRCGLASRLPILDQRELNLNPPGETPRGAVDVDVDLHGLRLRVIVAHLGLRRRERCDQVARLMAALADHGTRPLLIMGDFNEWHAHRATLLPLDERFGASTPAPSFPARFPFLALDRLWVGPSEASLAAVRVHRSPLARRASDHLPVSALARWRLEGGAA